MNRNEADSSDNRIPAAQYVRMSTEDQVYSIRNQIDAIQEYAAQYGFKVVKTYEDAGKSGVIIKRRGGLSQLLQDVLSGKASFKVILVYDVSRWGRFQDVDESAYYEFICKRSGTQVHYCAEQFSNDNTPTTAILKALKRSMAAEFSRELGEKVFRGKSRIARLGYSVGGMPGLGLRRMMISADGKRKRILKTGERKQLTTDRVIFVPGPKREIETIRRMFQIASERPIGVTEIVRKMNESGMLLHGRPWNHRMVSLTLRNPRYTGCNAWYRTTSRLRTKLTAVPRDKWILKPGAFVPLVDQVTFERVQSNLQKHSESRRWTDSDILKRLKRLLARKGKITYNLIQQMRGMAAHETLLHHFGSYQEMYKRVGYYPPFLDFFKGQQAEKLMRMRRKLTAEIESTFPEHVLVTKLPRRTRSILRIDDDFYVSIIMARFSRRRVKRQSSGYWIVNTNPAERNYVTLLCLLNTQCSGIHSLHIFPRMNVPLSHQLYESDPWLSTGKRLKNLSAFYQIVRALHQSEVASQLKESKRSHSLAEIA